MISYNKNVVDYQLTMQSPTITVAAVPCYSTTAKHE